MLGVLEKAKSTCCAREGIYRGYKEIIVVSFRNSKTSKHISQRHEDGQTIRCPSDPKDVGRLILDPLLCSGSEIQG